MQLQATLPGSTGLGSTFHLIPGLLLTAMLAGLGTMLHTLPIIGVFSPLILSILLGAVFHNVIGTPQRAIAGIAVSLRRILRLGIVLLGAQFTASQVADIGVSGIVIIAASLMATVIFTKAMGRWLLVDTKLTELIAAGTAICGASAIIATNTITRARDEDVAYAVACITIFGSAAMVLYPLAGAALALSAHDYGLWSGASIHEIAQVMAAAFQRGPEAGEFATVAKLTRVMMLAPTILVLGWRIMQRTQGPGPGEPRRNAPPVPWFIVAFLALAGINSVITIGPSYQRPIAAAASFLIAMALAAMGLGTDFRKLIATGPRPMLLGAMATLFISAFSLALVMLAR